MMLIPTVEQQQLHTDKEGTVATDKSIIYNLLYNSVWIKVLRSYYVDLIPEGNLSLVKSKR